MGEATHCSLYYFALFILLYIAYSERFYRVIFRNRLTTSWILCFLSFLIIIDPYKVSRTFQRPSLSSLLWLGFCEISGYPSIMDIFAALEKHRERSEKFLKDYAESERIREECEVIRSQIKELEAKLAANQKQLLSLLPAEPSLTLSTEPKRARGKSSNKLTSKQAKNLKLIFELMYAKPAVNTAKDVADELNAKIENCSQAKMNNLLNEALQLFPDLVTSVGKAAGRKVSLIQGVSLNELIQAVDSKTKSKS